MESLDRRFEKAVDLVGAGELEERAEDLRRAEWRGGRREGGGVEVVRESLEGQIGVREVEGAWAGGGGEGAEV